MSHHEASFIPIALSSIGGLMMVRGLGTVYLSRRGFETRASLSSNLDHAPKQSHSSHLFTFEAIRQRALVEAVMVRRTGKGYALTLVGQPPYEGGSGGSTSKGVIFDCEFGGKKGRIVVKCEPENPAKVTKEELDEAIKQAADYLEDELKAGRKPRRRYRLNNGQMFRQKKTRLKASGV